MKWVGGERVFVEGLKRMEGRFEGEKIEWIEMGGAGGNVCVDLKLNGEKKEVVERFERELKEVDVSLFEEVKENECRETKGEMRREVRVTVIGNDGWIRMEDFCKVLLMVGGVMKRIRVMHRNKELVDCVEVMVDVSEEEEGLRERMYLVECLDVNVQSGRVWNKRVVVFDMDSTLIEEEVIDEVSRVVGVYERVSMITEKAMNGEIGFIESFQERVGLLDGVEERVLDEVRVTLKEGSRELVGYLREVGCRMLIVSGGLKRVADRVGRMLGIEEVVSNDLMVEEGVIRGISGAVVDGERKRMEVERVCVEMGVDVADRRVLTVGDGSNDVRMLACGTGVCVGMKAAVRGQARFKTGRLGLVGVVCLLGMPCLSQ